MVLYKVQSVKAAPSYVHKPSVLNHRLGTTASEH